jgi:hypothetical protein
MKINDNGTDRKMTTKEEADHSATLEELAIIQQQEENAKADRQALKAATLAKLGLTSDEVAALLS